MHCLNVKIGRLATALPLVQLKQVRRRPGAIVAGVWPNNYKRMPHSRLEGSSHARGLGLSRASVLPLARTPVACSNSTYWRKLCRRRGSIDRHIVMPFKGVLGQVTENTRQWPVRTIQLCPGGVCVMAASHTLCTGTSRGHVTAVARVHARGSRVFVPSLCAIVCRS